MRWLGRYLDGDHVEVWHELTGLGGQIRDDPALYAEAAAVVKETMHRVRANVESLVTELVDRGYRFDSLAPHEPPSDDIAAQLDALEERIGPMPLSLRGWFEQVGHVDLTGTFRGWSYRYTDPLVVDAPIDYILSEFADWEDERGTEWARGPFTVELAPDWLHKANVSGGGPYAVEVPNRGMDGSLLEEPHSTTFVNYLRIAFGWGGFPGWDPGQPTRDRWAQPPTPAPSVIFELRDRLTPV